MTVERLCPQLHDAIDLKGGPRVCQEKAVDSIHRSKSSSWTLASVLASRYFTMTGV
jgi:hypothetical protein